jgi:hypothetical protein
MASTVSVDVICCVGCDSLLVCVRHGEQLLQVVDTDICSTTTVKWVIISLKAMACTVSVDVVCCVGCDSLLVCVSWGAAAADGGHRHLWHDDRQMSTMMCSVIIDVGCGVRLAGVAGVCVLRSQLLLMVVRLWLAHCSACLAEGLFGLCVLCNGNPAGHICA